MIFLPTSDISMFYTGYPLVDHTVILNEQLVLTLACAHGQYMGNLDSDREVARGVAESKSSFLSDLKTFHALYVSMNAQRKTT